MNKKLLAAAVATAFAAPVAMAQTNVTIYGAFNIDANWAKATATTGTTGTDLPSRMRIGQQGGSNIGFRGSEALGGGLSFVWQVEQAIGMDGTGTANTWGSRDSFFGLSGGFGTVTLGHITTPYATLINGTVASGAMFGATGPTGATSIISNTNLAGGAANFGTTATSYQASFNRRQESAIQYVTPNINGFTGRLMLTANEAKTNGAGTAAAGVTSAGATNGGLPANANPNLWSASLTYAAGPFLIGGAYEKHNDFRWSGTNTLDNKGWTIAGRWTSGPFMVSAAYEKLTYEVFSGGAKQDMSSNAWMLNGQYAMGPHRFRLGYGSRGEGSAVTGVAAGASLCVQIICSSSSSIVAGGVTYRGTKSNQLNLGYAYALSKRTELFGYYTKINNDPVARANMIGGQSGMQAGAAAAGSDITGYGIGLRHSF